MFADSLRDALHPPTEIAKGAHDTRHRGTTWLRKLRIDSVSLVPVGANRKVFTVIKSLDGVPAGVFDRFERVLTEWLAAS